MKTNDVKQRRTIVGAMDYTIASLNDIKKTLFDRELENQNKNWAVGGFIITLQSNLMRIIQETLHREEKRTAIDDLNTIQERFNALIEQMKTGMTND